MAIDLSKAFDSVCHPILLAKLKTYGFTHGALEIMTAYLIGRRQMVKLDGVHSTWRTMKNWCTTGVPVRSENHMTLRHLSDLLKLTWLRV